MLRFNANLFRIAMQAASNEETRYYLRGVYVEPHPVKGVTMTATDGCRMLLIHDESGEADESAIISLSPDALKLCKSKRSERRDIRIWTGEKDATICETFVAQEKGAETLTDRPLGMSYDCRIEGSFPDYRRAVPQAFTDKAAPCFAGKYLASMGLIALDLAEHFHQWKPAKFASGTDRRDGSRVLASECDNPEGAPALVQFTSIKQAFGILMPISNKGGPAVSLPEWFKAPQRTDVQAA
jgi:hypothetical protein